MGDSERRTRSVKWGRHFRRVAVAAAMLAALGGLAACGPAGSTPAAATASASVHASSKHAHRRHRLRRVHGKITALTTTALTIVTKAGVTHTIGYTGSTKVRQGRQVVTATALKVGETVTVVERHGSTPVAAVVHIAP